MGVPKFYRWISERYPQINQMLSGTTILPEFDNFYLDMNGIIHACTHPNDNSTANSLTLREMMLAIFRYIDHMVTEIVKPKKILFMAIDGVAPRAKLNQQRARRFRAAQERQESIAKARQKGETVDEENLFDSNCITPGTEFMEQVGKHLRYFIRKKIKEDPLWRDLRIVFSGHDVPGEGEHKIMQFMRDLRAEPGYEPNQRHCMYGQDADLIMLGLATHEPHFALLREVVDFNANRGGGSARQTVLRQTKSASFQLLHLSILREYLSLDFAFGCPWVPDQERLFDDFILLTFLVGNDFLPHLPSLDISEHAFDTLITAYRSLMAEEPGYIVHNGEIADLPRLEKLFAIIGSQESSILKAREEEVKAFNQKRRKYKDSNILTEEELEEAEEKLALAFETALNIAMGKDSSSEEDGSEGLGGEGEEVEGFTVDDNGMPVIPPAWEQVQKNLPTTVKGRKSGGSGKSKGRSDEEEEEEEEGPAKDYSGRYYYEKFKIVASTDKGQQFLSELMAHYLKGLMWCLAYYIKGCVSWTWYYPYHYGPMLKDMTELVRKSELITFELGQPFMPFQQLLGCLPPASCTLLPRPYQWLMISADSPVLHFYPVDFGIDQDGKKNPWEAVVLLDFIDEKALMAAEALHCPAAKLTKAEFARNLFGKVLTHLYDPGMVETYPSCNPEINLPDIPSCQSSVSESYPSLGPGVSFKAELVPGTVYPIAGYPSLTILPLLGMRTEAAKVNMFGSDSKYKSMILEIKSPQIENVDNLNAELLLGRIVYVNYPQIHEAKVLAVTTAKEEVRLVNGLPKRTVHDHAAARQWAQESEEEEEKYLKGRGTPGSGGLRVGKVVVRLRVAALQGLHRDPSTGASRKTFSTKEEADVPIQMALWTPPVADTRFEETAELTIEELMPHGAEVVALTGELLGVKGRVVGPHIAESATSGPGAAGKRGSLKSDIKKDQAGVAGNGASKKRVVDVEFTLQPPEPPFGYSIANSVKEEYYTSKDLCALLQITPSVLGKIVGMVRVEPGRADLGLNLKRNGQYQLLGYSQRVDYSNGGDSSAEHFQKRKVWSGVDTVEIVGMVSSDSAAANKAAEADAATWQYSARAAALIYDYKTSFPYLFSQLERLPHQPVYSPDALLGSGGEQKLEQVQEWMKAQPFFKLPRTPFTTSSLPKDAMAAIERAADVQTSKRAASTETKTIVVKGVPVEHVFCAVHRGVGDVSLSYNQLEPKLGDRVVNLTCPGVPFGFKGTVVTIHSSTKFVELIFDEEFIGGKGLQGSCSQFRGRLAPWSDLLLVSRTDEFQDFKKGKGAKGAAKPAWSAPAPVVSPAAKKNGAVAGHQVKQVLQRAAPTTANAAAKASYAHTAASSAPHAVALDAHGKPVLKQDAGASVGQKLLKALQKDDKEKATTTTAAHVTSVVSPASKVAILKKKIGIPDQRAGSTAPTSNGTGVNVLAQAAGFSVSDIGKEETLLPSSFSLADHHPMMGVISYQAHQASALNKSSLTTAPALPTPPPAAGASHAHDHAHPPHPPHAPPKAHGEKHASPQKQRPAAAHGQGASKLVLNKDATKRIVAHELKANGAAAPTASAASASAGEKKHVKDHKDEKEHKTTEKAAPTAGAALLASLKQNKAKPADKAAPAASETSSDAAASAPDVVQPAAPAAAPAAPLTMAEKLANAKKMMKEKQSKMAQLKKEGGEDPHAHSQSHAPAAHAPAAPAVKVLIASPSQTIKKTASGEHKADSHEKKAAASAPSIVSILTKAKNAAAEKPAHTAAVHTAAGTHAVTHHAAAGIHAPEPHHPKKAHAAGSASITDILKNAKRATTAAAAAAPAAADASAAHPATKASAPVAATGKEDAPSSAAATTGAAEAAPTVSPTAALKKKAPSSLVPSKVLITKTTK